MILKHLGWVATFPVLVVALAGCWSKDQVAKQVPQYGPHYCYASLAEPDCHPQPLDEDEARLVGWHEAPSGAGEIDIEVNCYRLLFVKEFCGER